MADTQNTGTQTSAAPAQTPEKKNLNVSQAQPDLVAIQKRRHDLIVKQNSSGGISPQEQEELNNLNKQLGKDSGGKAKINQDNKLAKEPDKEDEKIDDIFKEKDILKYMYEDWLLAGANWLFKKTYKGADWLAGYTTGKAYKAIGWAGSGVWKGIKKGAKKVPPLFKKTPPRNDAMTAFATALNTMHQESLGTKGETITGHLEDFGATLKRITEGHATEDDKRSPLYGLYERCKTEHPEKLKNFGEEMFTRAANATQNSMEIHRMAERLVCLRNLQSSMSNPNPQPLSPEMYKKEVNLMALVVARSVSQSPDPIKSMGMLDKNIKKSEEKMQSALMDGKYQAAGKSPDDNKKLNNQLAETFKSVGLDSNGLITKEKEEKLQKYTYNDPNSKKDLLERLVFEQVAASSLSKEQTRQETNEASLAQQQQDHQRRQQKCNPIIAAFYATHQDKFPGIVPNSNYSLEGQSPLRPEHHNTNNPTRPPFRSDRGGR